MSDVTTNLPDQIAGTELTPGELAELAFMTGVSADGTTVGPSGWNASTDIPITYSESSGSAHKWGGGAVETPGTVTYYFDPNSGFTASQISIYQASMQLWSDESGITFVQTTNPADAELRLYLYGTTTPNVTLDDGAYVLPAYQPVAAGSTTLATTQSALLTISQTGGWAQLSSFTYNGGYGPSTIVHELGHVLGLMHSGSYNGVSNALLQQLTPYDSYMYSIMSYLSPSEALRYAAATPQSGTSYSPQISSVTPQMLDIIGAQELYGAPTSTALTSGGQIFGFDSNITDASAEFFDFTKDVNPVVTLWDSGANNTLNISGYYTPATVNLNPGSFSSVDGMQNNIGIAYNTWIDTLVGGGGNDTITVNSQSDTIDGGGGTNTVVFGGSYADYVVTAANGTITVSNGTATDTLTNIQQLAFADQTVSTASLANQQTLAWQGGSGSFSDAASWANTSGGSDVVPGASDIATIAGPAGAPYTVSGNGAAAQLVTTGWVGVTGTLTPTLLTVGDDATTSPSTLVIAPGGTIVAASAAVTNGVIQDMGQMQVAGTLTVGDGSTSAALMLRNGGSATAQGVILAGGTITVDKSSGFVVGASTVTPLAQAIGVAAGSTLSGYGAVGLAGGGYLINNGTIIATGGTLSLGYFNFQQSAGTFLISNTGNLLLQGSGLVLTGAVSFLGATGTLTLANPSNAQISNLGSFNPGDAIVLNGVTTSIMQPIVDTATNSIILTAMAADTTTQPTTVLTATMPGASAGLVYFVLPNQDGSSTLLSASGSLTGEAAGQGLATARNLTWNPTLSGDWNTATNWFDTTNTVANAPTATAGAGSLDTVNLLGPYGLSDQFDVVSGNGNSAALNVTGAIAVSGTLTTGTLTVGLPYQATTFAVIGSGRVVAGTASINDTTDLTAGTTMTVSGTTTINDSAGAPILNLGGAAALQTGNLVLNAGTSAALTLGTGATIEVGTGANPSQQQQITVDAGSTLSGSGDLSQYLLLDNGVIDANGWLNLGLTTGTGSALIENQSTLAIINAGTVSPSYSVSFNGASGTLLLNGLHTKVSQTNFGTVTNFGSGDVLSFSYFGALQPTSFSYTSLGADLGQLLVGTTGWSDVVNLIGSFTQNDFQLAYNTADQFAEITYALPCFATGTLIATPDGARAVESLAAGDDVTTIAGKAESVVWVGHRRVPLSRHPHPEQVLPVRVSAHAFGPGLPERDLLLSPDHALFLEDVLIPVKYLIDGASIRQLDLTEIAEVTYWHVELANHEVLLAEGLPAESYLDTGDRRNFANGGDEVALFPDFSNWLREAEGFAPLVVTGPALEAARARLRPAAAKGEPAAIKAA